MIGLAALERGRQELCTLVVITIDIYGLLNALAYGSSINQNSRVANQLNNLASGINYYIINNALPVSEIFGRAMPVNAQPCSHLCLEGA